MLVILKSIHVPDHISNYQQFHVSTSVQVYSNNWHCIISFSSFPLHSFFSFLLIFFSTEQTNLIFSSSGNLYFFLKTNCSCMKILNNVSWKNRLNGIILKFYSNQKSERVNYNERKWELYVLIRFYSFFFFFLVFVKFSEWKSQTLVKHEMMHSNYLKKILKHFVRKLSLKYLLPLLLQSNV